MDALEIEQAIIGGFDWGARTANIIAALWPERCKALVSVSGYLIGSQRSRQDAAAAEGRAPVVVPVLLRHRARPGRLRQIPARVRQAHLADRLAEVGLRRRHVRPHRGGVRQSRSRRDRDPQLPLAARPRRRRAAIRRSREAAGRRARSSPCRRSRWKAMPTARRIRTPAAYAKKFSGKYAHRLITAASATTCRRKRRRPLPRPSSTSPKPRRRTGSGRKSRSTAYTFSTCRYSNSTGVERQKLDMLTFTRPFSSGCRRSTPSCVRFNVPPFSDRRDWRLLDSDRQSVASCQGSKRIVTKVVIERRRRARHMSLRTLHDVGRELRHA